MSKHQSPRPRWLTHPEEWQAQLLRNPHLSPAEKLTALAMRKHFTGMGAVWVDLADIAEATAQSVDDVRAHIERLDGIAWKVG